MFIKSLEEWMGEPKAEQGKVRTAMCASPPLHHSRLRMTQQNWLVALLLPLSCLEAGESGACHSWYCLQSQTVPAKFIMAKERMACVLCDLFPTSTSCQFISCTSVSDWQSINHSQNSNSKAILKMFCFCFFILQLQARCGGSLLKSQHLGG